MAETQSFRTRRVAVMPASEEVAVRWPDGLDATVTAVFLLIAFGLPTAGYVAMALDIRAYLLSLRRALIVVGSYLRGTPSWARPYTPPSLFTFGLTMPCSEEELLRAYRDRVKGMHPDRGGDKRQFLRLQSQFEDAIQYIRSQALASRDDLHSAATHGADVTTGTTRSSG
jgi:hypothetical protein